MRALNTFAQSTADIGHRGAGRGVMGIVKTALAYAWGYGAGSGHAKAPGVQIDINV